MNSKDNLQICKINNHEHQFQKIAKMTESDILQNLQKMIWDNNFKICKKIIWTNNLQNLSGVIICKICIIRHLELQFVKFTKRNDNLQFANDDHHFVLFLHDDRHIITLPISPFNDVSTMTIIYFLQAFYQKIIQTSCCSLNTKVCW